MNNRYIVKKYWIGTLLSAFLFSGTGCSLLGPTYVKPKVETPTQWNNHKTDATKDKNVNLAELAWWKQFNDPQLDGLIYQALQPNNNYNLNIATANLEYAQAQLKQVKLSWIPSMNFWGGYSSLPYLGDAGYFFGLFPNYVLNVFQQIKMQKSAEYQLEASQYAQDSVRLTVIGQVSASYFTLLAQTESLTLYYQLLHDNQRLLALYKRQYEAGIVSEDSLDHLNSDIQKINAQIIVTQHNIHVSKNALRYLMGQNPGNLVLKKSFNQIPSDAIIPGDLPLTVLNNRPDVRQSEALLKTANANIGVATTNLLPSIKLDNLMIESSTANGYVNLNEAIINIPVVAPTVAGQISASKAQYHAAYSTYVNTIKVALRDVENDFSGYSAYRQKLIYSQKAFTDEQHSCYLNKIRYEQGIDSDVDVTQCAIKLNYLALTLNQDKLEKMMALVALYQDLAGGYQSS